MLKQMSMLSYETKKAVKVFIVSLKIVALNINQNWKKKHYSSALILCIDI